MSDRLAYGAATLEAVMAHLSENEEQKASDLVSAQYPFVVPLKRRGISVLDRMRVFLRDGVIDRYGGLKLFLPPVLEVIALEIPEVFPSTRNGKASETHIAFWELYPAIDHLVPLARGGADESSNWITTSSTMNARKGNHTLEDLGWALLDPGSLEDWDGGLRWFFDYVEGRGSALLGTDDRAGEWPSNRWFREWHRAARRALEELEGGRGRGDA